MHRAGRETFLVKVDWVDDWPIFNEGKNVTLRTNGRYSVAQHVNTEALSHWKAALDQPDLERGWYQKRTWGHMLAFRLFDSPQRLTLLRTRDTP